MEEQIRSHHTPAQAWPPAHGGICVGHVEHALTDEVDDLAIQRSLQTIGDMADHFFTDMDRFLADGSVKRDRLLHCLCRGLFSSDDLDQRNDVRRVKWMTDDATLGMHAG